MISFPNCKINLGLNIIKKRNDGYHEITSLMYPLPIYDLLEIIVLPNNQESNLTLSGDKIEGALSDNLCWKAYRLLQADFELPPVHIHLHKLIPMGGGLGGGSANGTYTLLLLNDLLNLSLSNEQLKHYAQQLGSDCAFFVENKPQFATGRGEKLSTASVSLEGKYLLLINDGTHVSTQMAYQNVCPAEPSEQLSSCIERPISEWKNCLVNDFEQSVFNQFPNLEKIKKELYANGAIYASMTGSGATVYGVFEEKPKDVPQYNEGFVRVIAL